jgi:hypothetical protein
MQTTNFNTLSSSEPKPTEQNHDPEKIFFILRQNLKARSNRRTKIIINCNGTEVAAYTKQKGK